MAFKYQSFYKDVLLATMKMSTCARLQVAAIIVKDGRIINSGWNGTMPGKEHCNQHFNLTEIKTSDFYKIHGDFSIKNEGHAEISAIAYAARFGTSTDNCEMAVSHTPCVSCAKAIILAGIKRVYYLSIYDRDKTGLELLIENNIDCVQL